MRLTRDLRARLFDGLAPHIVGDPPCPWKPGDVYNLSARLSLRVIRVDARKGGGWKLHYEVSDRRDPPRLLRRTPPVTTSDDYDRLRRTRGPDGVAREEGVDTTEESNYCAGGPAAIADADEAPPADWLERHVKPLRARDMTRREEQAGARSLANKLKQASVRAQRQGLDVSPEMRQIQAGLEGIERKLDAA